MSVLGTLDFQPLLITEVFEHLAASSVWYDKNKLDPGAGPFPYVSRSAARNGHESAVKVQDLPPNAGNAITVGVDTQTVFYQPMPFYTSVNVQVLRHPRLSAINGPVLVAILREQMMKFQWGNGASLVRLRATRIMVPVTGDQHGNQVVDWDGLDRLGSELLDRVIRHTRSARQTHEGDDDSLPDLRFEPMLIPDVFDVCRQAPAWLNTNQVVSGAIQYPHVTNTARRNSVAGFIARQKVPPNHGNVITVGIDTQVVAYQPVPYYGATKVLELRAPMLNEANAALLMTSLREAITKFSWGHKASAVRLRATRIMVPVTTDANGQPCVDWDGMTAYGRALRVRAERSLAPALEVA